MKAKKQTTTKTAHSNSNKAGILVYARLPPCTTLRSLSTLIRLEPSGKEEQAGLEGMEETISQTLLGLERLE